MDIINTLGLIAGILTTTSFIPQVIKIYRTKETKDISLAMFIILSAGITMWIIYGLYIKSMPVILANTVTLTFSFIIIICKIRYH